MLSPWAVRKSSSWERKFSMSLMNIFLAALYSLMKDGDFLLVSEPRFSICLLSGILNQQLESHSWDSYQLLGRRTENVCTVEPPNNSCQGTTKFYLLMADFCYCQYKNLKEMTWNEQDSMPIIGRFCYSRSGVAGSNCIETVTVIYLLRQKENFRDRKYINIRDRKVTEIQIRDKEKVWV